MWNSAKMYFSRRNRWVISGGAGLLLMAGLSGCSPTGTLLGAGAMAGTMVLEERSVEDNLTDKGIVLAIKKRMVATDPTLFTNVTVNAIEGRVLLTGAVSTQGERVEALKLAWEVKGVEEVLNEIQVTEDGKLLDKARDLSIKTRLVSALTFNRNVHAVNYQISVTNRTVYLFGITRNQQERKDVIQQARALPYVRRIVDHTRLANDPAREARRQPSQDTQESSP